MNRKCLAVSFILLSLSLFSGCWDVEEINRRALILALGFDITPAGMIKMSAQIPVVADLAPGAGYEKESQAKPFHIVSGEAETSFGPIPFLQGKTINYLFAGQVKTTIISADLARLGLKPYVDFLDRHPEIPPAGVAALTEGNARDILDTTLNSKMIPGLAILNFLRSGAKADQAYTMRLWQFISAMTVGPEDAYLPVITVSQPEQTYVINGIGVFHHDRLVGQISGNETRMFGFLSGKAINSYPSLYINNKLGQVTYRNVEAKTKTKAFVKGDHVEFLIKARVKGFLIELTSSKSPLTLKDLKVIQSITARNFKAEMAKTMSRLQELNSDILGLGELVRATLPEVWKRINWDEEYPRVKVNIDVKFTALRTGAFR